MPEVVKEPVTQTTALVGARYETGDVEELDRDGAAAFNAGAVVRPTFVLEVISGTGARDLKITDRSLGVDGGKSR